MDVTVDASGTGAEEATTLGKMLLGAGCVETAGIGTTFVEVVGVPVPMMVPIMGTTADAGGGKTTPGLSTRGS